MDWKELSNRFEYHPQSDAKVQDHQFVRDEFWYLADKLNQLLPEGREKSLVMTSLEEGMFWANAAIAREFVWKREERLNS